jgi:hypothetical protein
MSRSVKKELDSLSLEAARLLGRALRGELEATPGVWLQLKAAGQVLDRSGHIRHKRTERARVKRPMTLKEVELVRARALAGNVVPMVPEAPAVGDF